MSEIGRNAPCPCGSGKKYKKCCRQLEQQTLLEVAQAERRAQALKRTMQKVMHWYDSNTAGLGGKATWAVDAVGEDDFDEICDAVLDDSEDQQAYFGELLFLMTMEKRLFEDRKVEDGDSSIDLVDVLLGRQRCSLLSRAPEFDSLERSWLEAWANSPLRLYEVVELHPGIGITFEDLLSGERIPTAERSGSEMLRLGTTAAARIIDAGEDLPRVSYLWGINPAMRQAGLSRLRSSKSAAADEDVFSSIVRETWLLSYRPMALPEIVDMGTGEPMQLTTVHYRVLDWNALSSAMESLPDWSGSREHGWDWLEPSEGEMRRLLGSLNLSAEHDDRVELFSRSSSRAEEAQSTVESVAGEALERLHTESADLQDLLAQRGSQRMAPPGSAEAKIPPEEMTNLLQKTYEERIYANFFDDPLPYLDGEAPAEAMKTKAGARKVEDLIADYKSNERRLAASQDREPANFEFLERKFSELLHGA